jgi:hypothetical protein
VVADGAAKETASREIAPDADGDPPLMYVCTEPMSVAVAVAPLPAIAPPADAWVVALAPSGRATVEALDPSALAL